MFVGHREAASAGKRNGLFRGVLFGFAFVEAEYLFLLTLRLVLRYSGFIIST